VQTRRRWRRSSLALDPRGEDNALDSRPVIWRPPLARRRRADRRRGCRGPKLCPQPPRRRTWRPRKPRLPEVAQRTCTTRDAALLPRFFFHRCRIFLVVRAFLVFRAPPRASSRSRLTDTFPRLTAHFLVTESPPQLFPAAIVKGQTNTDSAHERLESIGVTPRLKTNASPNEKFPFVVFSAPPSGSEDYALEVKHALQLWDGTGGFVFTSSTAVYAGKDGEECDESTPVFAIGENPRADTLLQAEEAVLEAGGCVVRLSGLYHATRGAHMYFLKSPALKSGADGLVNLVHYEDAASAVAAALVAQLEGGIEGGEVFLATDGVPISRKDMVQACLESTEYEGAMPTFDVDDAATGKRMSNLRTRERLGWEPAYASFAEFVAKGASDSFSSKKKKFR